MPDVVLNKIQTINLNIEIVVAIVQKHLGDFEGFVREVFSGYLDEK